MKTNTIVRIAERVKKQSKITILDVSELVDTKVEEDMEKVIQKLDLMNNSINTKFDAMNTKYNVLIGMITLGMVFIGVLKFLE